MVVIGVCAMISCSKCCKRNDKERYPAFPYLRRALNACLELPGFGDKSGMTLGHLGRSNIHRAAFAGYIFYMVRIALKGKQRR